jgi:toxin-antitoxin system PIN domain toxin
MPAFGIKLADANVWLALSFTDHVHHFRTKAWFSTQLEGSSAFCRVTQMALLRHLTNAKIMGRFVLSQQQAWQAYDDLTADPRVTFLTEPAGLVVEFRNVTQSSSPSHDRWTDAYLAAFAKLYSAQLVTFDRGFASYPGLNVELLS